VHFDSAIIGRFKLNVCQFGCGMANSSGWYQEISYLRAIAIIEVVVIHAAGRSVYYTDMTAITLQKGVLIAFWAFSLVAVPLFIFISGFVLYSKYKTRFSVLFFYKKRFASVLPPYLIFCTFYLLSPFVGPVLAWLHQPTVYASNLNIPYLLIQYARGLAFGTGPMYFVVLIMQLYLLYPAIVKLYNSFASKKNGPLYVLLFLLAAQLGFDALFNPPPLTRFRWLFLSGLFYFVLGFFVVEHYSTLRQQIENLSLTLSSLLVLFSTLCFADLSYHVLLLPDPAAYYLWLDEILTPLYCVLLIVFFLRITITWGEPHNSVTRSLERIGEDSFGIYLVHYAFIVALPQVLVAVGLNPNNLPFYLILVALVLMLSDLCVQVLYRLPLSSIIVGKPRLKGRSPA
jgi:peptidoglycan/LPS O-acetylase OafA/YrhL